MITHLLKDETWYIKDNGGKGSLVGIASTRSNWFVAEEVLKKHAPLIASAPEMLDILIKDTAYLINNLPDLEMVNNIMFVIIKKIEHYRSQNKQITLESWENLFTKIKIIEKATGLPIEEVLK